MPTLRKLILPLLLFLLPLAGAAQAPGTVTGTETGNPGQGTDGKVTPQASIQAICVGTATEIGTNTEPHTVHLGDWLTLDVTGVEGLGEEAKKLKRPLQLYLNGLPLAGVPAIKYQPSGEEPGCLDGVPAEKPPGHSLLRFHLVRNDESKDTWALLLGRAGSKNRQVEVSVGIAGCAEGCTDISTPMPISLDVIRQSWFIGYCFVLVLLLGSLLVLAYRTPLLRDRGKGSPWSLGRNQMAWWFFFVIAAFLYMWMVTGSYSSLTNSVLALIGISATTAVVGAVMDDNKEAEAAKKPGLENEKTALEAASLTATATAPAGQANTLRLQQVYTELAQMPEEQVTSQGYWKDLLSDENGISFHRYQIVIWTLVLTVIFLVKVHVNLAMPDFDGQLLALMGISSGTYLGFKFPEKKV